MAWLGWAGLLGRGRLASALSLSLVLTVGLGVRCPPWRRVPRHPCRGGGVCRAALTERARASLGAGKRPGSREILPCASGASVRLRGDFPARGDGCRRNGVRPRESSGGWGERRAQARCCFLGAADPSGAVGSGHVGDSRSLPGCPPAGVAGRGWATREVALGASLLTVQRRVGKMLQ